MGWFYAIDNQQHGPVDEDRLRELARAGSLKEDDLIWTEGMEQWQPAHTVDSLAFSMAPQTASDGSQPLPRHSHEPYDGFFSHKGRINRLKYFWQMLALAVLGYCVGFIFGLNGLADSAVFAFSTIALSFLTAFPIVRRLHDLNKPGGWYWLSWIPFVNIAFALYLTFAKGTEGPNKYGPDPLRSQPREPATATVAKRQPSHANTSSS